MTSLPIPERLNLTMACAIVAAGVGLLWLGSNVNPAWMWLCALAFSFVMLTNYALIHEATHGMLHSQARVNELVGTILAWFFPTSFSMLRLTHIVHHCCNRTDHEMFDYYYPADNRFLKWGQWYGILLGVWWWLIPIGTVLFAIVPGITHTALFRRARSSAVMFDGFGPSEIRRVRLEVIGGILFWSMLISLLSLSWMVLFSAYVCFSFNWSSRQYVTHAFTPRDVRNGALNLRVSQLMSWVLLRGNWDLVHHRHPHVAWLYLPELGRNCQRPTSYWRQYLRQWKGPRPAVEAAPPVLSRKNYQEM